MLDITKKTKDIQGFIFINVIRALFFILALLLILLLGKIVIEGASKFNIEFIFSSPTNNMTSGGIGPAIFGTLAVTFIMIIFAVPLGVFSAIYLNEYAKDTFWTRIIRTAVNNLAGVPSIVFGLFGLGFFILFVGRGLDNVLKTGLLFGQPCLLWASATLAVLVLPVVIVSTLEALNSVPKSRQRRLIWTWSNKMADHQICSTATGKAGYSNRYNIGDQQGSGRNCTNFILRSGILSANFTSNGYLHRRLLYTYDKSHAAVYVFSVSYFYFSHTIV